MKRVRNPFRSDVMGDPDGLCEWMVFLSFALPLACAVILWATGNLR